MNSERSRIVSPVIGLSLIIIGALFLFGRLFNAGPFWPLFILVPGVVFLSVAVRGGRSAAPLAIPGMLISGTGAILLYQSVTNHWQSWAYAWALYPALLGMGMSLMGRLDGNIRAIHAGRQFTIVGLGAFVVLGLFFETAIFSGIVRGLGLPLILLVLGVLFVLRGARPGRKSEYSLRAPLKSKRGLYRDVLHSDNGKEKTPDHEILR